MFSSACSFSLKIDVSKSLCPFQGTFLASVRAFLEWCPSHGPFWTGCLPYRFSWSPTSLFTSYMCLFPWKAVTLKQCNCTADIFNWYLTPLLSFQASPQTAHSASCFSLGQDGDASPTPRWAGLTAGLNLWRKTSPWFIWACVSHTERRYFQWSTNSTSRTDRWKPFGNAARKCNIQ